MIETTSIDRLSNHQVFNRVFQKNRLTFGLIAPLEGYPNSPVPSLTGYERLIRQADDVGISAIWLRDVPFLDPQFGDAGQVFDAMTYASWIAGITKNIAIGTSGVVLPLRDPVIVAKQSATIDHLSKGRMLLGLASGDRMSEYPAFGVDFGNRTERYQEARNIIRVLTEEEFPHLTTQYYGELNGTLDMVPKPVHATIPTLAIGRAGQNIDWLANHMDGWIWHGANAARMTDIIPEWVKSCGKTFKPFGYGVMFDLAKQPDEKIQLGRGFLRGGRNNLIDFWKNQEDAGLSHALLNLKPTQRPAEEIIEEFANHILPQFNK